MNMIKNTLEAIELLIEYATDINYSVIVGNEKVAYSECDSITRSITINETDNTKMLYILLHEIGHALIFETEAYMESFGEISKQVNKPREEQDNVYHYQVLKEEMLAWETGLNLAESLNIFIDFEDYDRHAADSYMSYVYRAGLNYYQGEVQRIASAANIEIKF